MCEERKYFPQFGVWELTNRCNARCIHCGSDSGECRDNELSEAEALKLCEDLRELGCKKIGIIGGEFFLSPYWENVTKKLMDLGIGVTHLTNGFLLNEQNIGKLKNLGIRWISVSIDGVGATHDYLRGVPGLFHVAVENIKKARSEGFRVGINTAISRQNVGELAVMFHLFTELGISSWQLQGVEDFGRANANSELQMTAVDFYGVIQEIAEFRKNTQMRIVLGDNIGHFTSLEPEVRDNPFMGCIAGRYNIGIEANGNIRGCLSIRGDANVVGNIRQRPLREIWQDEEAFAPFRQKTMEKMCGFCAKCKYAELCRAGCASMAYSLTGDFHENPLCLYKYEVENGIE